MGISKTGINKSANKARILKTLLSRRKAGTRRRLKTMSETRRGKSKRKGTKIRRKTRLKSRRRRKSKKKSKKKSRKKSRRKSRKKSRRKSMKKSRRKPKKNSRSISKKKTRTRSRKKSRRKSRKKSRRESKKRSRFRPKTKSRRRIKYNRGSSRKKKKVVNPQMNDMGKDGSYIHLMKSYQKWMQTCTPAKSVDICSKFGGNTAEGRDEAFQRLHDFCTSKFIKDMSSVYKCFFDDMIRLWAPPPTSLMDQAETYIAQDMTVRSLFGTNRHGFLRDRPYTLVWVNDENNPTSRLRRLLRSCKIVAVQLDMQFSNGSAHAGILLFDSNQKKTYVFDPNGSHGLLLGFNARALELFIKQFGFAVEYLSTPNCNLLLPSRWQDMWMLIDPMTAYAHLAGARKRCMDAIARHGYCLWISLYVTLEVLNGDSVHSAIYELTKLSQSDRYVVFESFIAYLITLLSAVQN